MQVCRLPPPRVVPNPSPHPPASRGPRSTRHMPGQSPARRARRGRLQDPDRTRRAGIRRAPVAKGLDRAVVSEASGFAGDMPPRGAPRGSAQVRPRPHAAPHELAPGARPRSDHSPAVPRALLLSASPTLPRETWGPAGDPKRGWRRWTRPAEGPSSPATPQLLTAPGGSWTAAALPARGCRGPRKRADLGDPEPPERKRLRTNPPRSRWASPLKEHTPLSHPRAGPKGRLLGSNSEMLVGSKGNVQELLAQLAEGKWEMEEVRY